MQGDKEQAEKYAELAKDSDSYNAAAFVNMGNCSFEKGDIEKAKVRVSLSAKMMLLIK